MGVALISVRATQTLSHPSPSLPCFTVLQCESLLGGHTFLSLFHLSGLLQATQLTSHSPYLQTLPQLLQRPQLQLVPQLLGLFLYPAHTP